MHTYILNSHNYDSSNLVYSCFLIKGQGPSKHRIIKFSINQFISMLSNFGLLYKRIPGERYSLIVNLFLKLMAEIKNHTTKSKYKIIPLSSLVLYTHTYSTKFTVAQKAKFEREIYGRSDVRNGQNLTLTTKSPNQICCQPLGELILKRKGKNKQPVHLLLNDSRAPLLMLLFPSSCFAFYYGIVATPKLGD